MASTQAGQDDPTADCARADSIIRGEVEAAADEAFALALRLIRRQQFGRARKLLRRAREGTTQAGQGGVLSPGNRTEARQKLALATYRDPDVPVSSRLRKALAILGEDEDLATSADQETLGIAGAIWKRTWEATTRVADLERSLAYYRRGYEQGLGEDGYNGINAAFVLDQLAAVETEGQRGDAAAEARRGEADEIRTLLVARLKARGEAEPDNWWLQATLGEACLGLRRFGDATYWLSRHEAIGDLPEWQLESTTRQIGALCNLRARRPDGTLMPGAEAALEVLIGQGKEALTTAFAGKVGVALSGGGFRASFFHIGVLARLAELGMLRHVEVLSCVSGGSIVGAQYYLELQDLLEGKNEEEIEDADYVRLVASVEEKFLAGVRKNIRMRAMGNPISNLRTIFFSGWTRTHEAGRAYERHLFSAVGGRSKRHMEDLLIHPAEEGKSDDEKAGRPDFNPKRDNWRRRFKVPILVLNATTLNTGHNWQFTASWMGEPPAVVDEDIDANPRLRRMYYDEEGAAGGAAHRRIRLGEAVAASACVPGLFEPLTLKGLYEAPAPKGGREKLAVELVDGGVHDNQGVASLIEQECTVMIVSDASGQMTCENAPARDPLGVPLRSSSVLSARVREAQLRDLVARRSSSALRGLLLVHLRMGLAEPPLDWIGAPDPYDPADDVTAAAPSSVYGIPAAVQQRLASIRTDLDAFSDMEAETLMLSGYLMTKESFPERIAGFPVAESNSHPWKFLEAAAVVDPEGEEHERLLRVLGVGAERWFKAWRLNGPLRWSSYLLGTILVLALAALLWRARDTSILTPYALLVGAAAIVLVGLARKLLVGAFEPRNLLARVVLGAVLIAAAPVALLQILVLDRLYLRAGRIKGSSSD